MNLHRLGRAAAFVAGSIVGGLALAFVIVFLRPQLLQQPAAVAAPEPAGVSGGPGAITLSASGRTHFLGADIVPARGAHVTLRHSDIRAAQLLHHRPFARTILHGVGSGDRLRDVVAGAGRHRG